MRRVVSCSVVVFLATKEKRKMEFFQRGPLDSKLQVNFIDCNSFEKIMKAANNLTNETGSATEEFQISMETAEEEVCGTLANLKNERFPLFDEFVSQEHQREDA